jgi:putative endonuclease
LLKTQCATKNALFSTLSLPMGASAARRRALHDMPFQVYILLCERDKLYVGSCEDLKSRFETHLKGEGARFTKQHRPIEIVYSETSDSRAEAMAREAQIKKWSRAKKQALIDRNISQLKRLSISRDHQHDGLSSEKRST